MKFLRRSLLPPSWEFFSLRFGYIYLNLPKLAPDFRLPTSIFHSARVSARPMSKSHGRDNPFARPGIIGHNCVRQPVHGAHFTPTSEKGVSPEQGSFFVVSFAFVAGALGGVKAGSGWACVHCLLYLNHRGTARRSRNQNSHRVAHESHEWHEWGKSGRRESGNTDFSHSCHSCDSRAKFRLKFGAWNLKLLRGRRLDVTAVETRLGKKSPPP